MKFWMEGMILIPVKVQCIANAMMFCNDVRWFSEIGYDISRFIIVQLKTI